MFALEVMKRFTHHARSHLLLFICKIVVAVVAQKFRGDTNNANVALTMTPNKLTQCHTHETCRGKFFEFKVFCCHVTTQATLGHCRKV